ncbi:MAG: N-acetylmuramic acid 6-phosphate etherase [Phycisphaerales bacterium]
MSERLPPDRAAVPTEARHPETGNAATTRAFLDHMAAADRQAVQAVGRELDTIAALVDDIAERFARGGRVIYVGAGTSGRLGVLDASECPPTFLVPPDRVIGIIAGGDAALRQSSESLEDDPDGVGPELDALGVGPLDTVIGITAGGTTPYALGAVRLGAAAGARTALITCGITPDDPRPDFVVNPRTGPEVVAGSTRLKAGTATKLVLNMISTGLMVRLEKVYEGLMVDVSATNDKLRDRAARVITMLTGLGREDAFDLLERAGGRVKPAVIMDRRGVGLADAERLLEEHAGSLRRALEAGQTRK